VADALDKLSDDLSGDVKRLTNFTPEYRLRVGVYRALFEVAEGNRAVVCRIVHRRAATGRMSGMLTLHPSILERDGKKEFAVLPYEEFEKLTEELQDHEDLKDLRAAKAAEGEAEAVPLADVRRQLQI